MWISNDNPNNKIRYFQNILTLMLGGKSNFCFFMNKCCSNFITIEPDGSVRPCDNLLLFDNMTYGNIYKDSLVELIEKAALLDNSRPRIAAIKCNSCKWFKVCNGCCSQD